MNNKQLVLPALPVRGVWGVAYLTKAGAYKVTAFEADVTKSEMKQPSQKEKDTSLRNLGLFVLILGAALAGAEFFLRVSSLLTIGGIAIAVIGLIIFIINSMRNLSLPQAHAQINTVTPSDIDTEINELVTGFGSKKYDVHAHARLYELVKNKQPLS